MPSPHATVRLPGVPALSWDDCRLLVESVVDYAIFMLDPEGYVATWNIGAERIKGYLPSEIVGQHFSRFYLDEERAVEKPQRALEVAAQLGRYEDEGWRVRKDGSRFWASVIITALRDSSGLLRGFGKVTRDLSAKREAEEELQRSEERFRLLVENIGDYAIYLLDPTGKVTTWNLGAERMKGYAAAEIIGEPFDRFFPAEDIAAGKPAAELTLARAHGRHEDEGWRVRRDGSRFWANAILTTLHDPQGAVIGFAKITRDLTSRRQAEENARNLLREQVAREVAEHGERRLRESEERYRTLSRRLEIVFDGVADGITAQDASGRVVFANKAAARLCGLNTPQELMDTPVPELMARFEMLDADDQPFNADGLPGRRIFAGEPPRTVTFRVRERATMREWWVMVRGSAVLDPSGKPELAINIWHDVSAEQQQAFAAKYLDKAIAVLAGSLRQDEMLEKLASILVPNLADWCSIYVLEEERLRDVTTLHAARSEQAQEYRRGDPPDPAHTGVLWSVLRSGKTEVLNDLGEGAFGRSTSAPDAQALLRALGMRAALLVPITVHERVLGVMALAYADTARHYATSDIALVEELGRRAGVAVENAQLYLAAKRAAQDADRAAQAAEEASRAKDEFLATVSHELRTPLSAILGWATLLKDRITDPNALKPIEVIHRNARAQVAIIDDILDVSRVITGKFRIDPKPTDLVSVARDAIEVIRPSADAKKIAIEFTPGSEFCLLIADAERMQQVVWNLLSNAVKFTPAGGTIRLHVGPRESQVQLQVSDTGKGIDTDFLPFVFDRFRQQDSSTTRRVGGLGLGLALVRHIVELHGGRVEASSDGPGRGATFTLWLPVRAIMPRSVDPEQPQRSAAPSSVSPSLAGIRVLVIDDEPDARELVLTVLSELGAVVETAASAADGFAAFKRLAPDVIVSDIGMPEEDGLSFIRRIRALPANEGARVPALALTAFTREQDRTRALSAGYTTHIGKPVNSDALAAAVANLAGLRARD